MQTQETPKEELAPITQWLVGLLAKAPDDGVDEADYKQYLEDKYL